MFCWLMVTASSYIYIIFSFVLLSWWSAKVILFIDSVAYIYIDISCPQSEHFGQHSVPDGKSYRFSSPPAHLPFGTFVFLESGVVANSFWFMAFQKESSL